MLKRSIRPIEKNDFYKELLSFAVPIGLQNLLVALIGASDALMLGRLTQDAVSAVSLANQIAFIMNLFSGAVVGGGGALLAQYWGKGDRIMVKNLFCMLMKWAFGISFVFSMLALFTPEILMRIYTPDAALIEIGASYLRAVGISYLFSGITQCYYLMMKLEGKATRSVLISVVTLITDVVLDFFLIYGIAGVPKLGANGSAYSTVAVELVALIWCIAQSHRGESIRPDMQGFRWFSADVTKDLFKIALPMLGSSLAWGFGFSMHSLIMGHLGSDATAAASIASVAQELITCICKGISAGAGIMLGKLLGQRLFDKAREYGRKFCHISFWTGGIHMALLCILGPVVTEFFTLSETAKHYLVIMLIFSAFYVFAYSVNTVIVCGIFPAGGDARYDAVSVFFATWCFALPLALLGTFVFNWPVIVVYILMCADEIVKLPWLYPRYKKYLWLKNLTREEHSGIAEAE
ncbi:MATE family efflux transporter [Lachnotalea sp. AF33-28]|jgi:putative MATE family efflux protein|uniref:MATE family efflux transporter n=1 Tax=Lachnotalea sp. AF33-28 TaxID=2292046 RepID=UPI000E476767|nr:MATE family efflux transporter [Lachnotalea sp. AF33-28]RHP34840.1 MATE family efflux transporter [Lachnotalea sp. AF33-28]